MPRAASIISSTAASFCVRPSRTSASRLTSWLASGEYVSGSSQSGTENADLDRERVELATDAVHEHEELADEVATQLVAKDALGVHARDELGISDTLSARPVRAAFASAATFAVGAAMPLLLVWTVSGGSLFFLALLGGMAARAGGSPVLKSVARVTFWGALAMTLTAGVGALFGATV